MAEEDGKPIRFKHENPACLIRTTPFNGYLIEKTGRHGKGTGQVVWKNITRRNKRDMLVNVYTYTASTPIEGTYVVLEFQYSHKLFYASKDDPTKLRLKAGDWDPYPDCPEDITTTSDPRVFLMTRSGADVVFAWHGLPSYIITVFPNPEKPAENLPEGENGQQLQLVPPKLRCSADGDYLEVVE